MGLELLMMVLEVVAQTIILLPHFHQCQAVLEGILEEDLVAQDLRVLQMHFWEVLPTSMSIQEAAVLVMFAGPVVVVPVQ